MIATAKWQVERAQEREQPKRGGCEQHNALQMALAADESAAHARDVADGADAEQTVGMEATDENKNKMNTANGTEDVPNE